MLVDEFMQPFAVTCWDLECPLIGNDDQHFAEAVVNHGAAAAHLQVGFDLGAQTGLDLAFNKAREFFQHVFAAHHGFFPFNKGTRSSHLRLNAGANLSRIISRARCDLTFTTCSETSLAAARGISLGSGAPVTVAIFAMSCCIVRFSPQIRYRSPGCPSSQTRTSPRPASPA